MPVVDSPARAWSPDLRRSVRLLGEFRYEQPDPGRFYRALADDSAAQLAAYAPLDGRLLLDVGGGPGYFAEAFEAAGARYLSVDADAGELSGLGAPRPGTVMGSGLALPFRDACIDVCYSSNVLEHVPDPWRMAGEMLRVTRPGGTVFLSYTVWYGPWGGHETSPWHLVGGGSYARRRYRGRHGREPKNRYGESLFRVTVAAGMRWATRQRDAGVADVVAVVPRYHPRWAHWTVHVPALRELTTWNLVIVLRRR